MDSSFSHHYFHVLPPREGGKCECGLYLKPEQVKSIEEEREQS